MLNVICIFSDPDIIVEMCVFNDTVPSGSNGYFISPNYPDNYGPNLDCTLVLPGTGTMQTLHVNVIAFDTEQDYDFLEVHHGFGVSVYHGNGRTDDTAMAIGRNYTCKCGKTKTKRPAT